MTKRQRLDPAVAAGVAAGGAGGGGAAGEAQARRKSDWLKPAFLQGSYVPLQ